MTATATLDEKFGVVDSKALATAAGITVPSLRVLRSRAIKRREEKVSLPTDLPSPDGTIGRSPVWTTDTAQKWLNARAEAGLDNQPSRHPKNGKVHDTAVRSGTAKKSVSTAKKTPVSKTAKPVRITKAAKTAKKTTAKKPSARGSTKR